MEDPKVYGIVPERVNEPVIWAVDDAWFDSYDATRLAIDDLPAVMGGVSAAKTLGELSEVIKAARAKSESSGDLEYLNILVELCIQNNLQLGLCNFDCFHSNFLLLNQPGSAILLDVHSPSSRTSDYPAAAYGIYLLHEVLEGSRPQADIFLVTGNEPRARNAIENKRYDPTWWPLIGIQIVSKADERLRDSLEAFVRYFVQGLERDPFIKLARGLIAARLRGNTHPTSLKNLVESSRGLPLAESFVRLEKEKKTQGLKSFKALYHSYKDQPVKSEESEASEPVDLSGENNTPDESELPLPEYPISNKMLTEHCRYLGIDLKVGGLPELYLPIQPGLVFILYFCAFISKLKEKPTVQLSCTKNQNGGTGKMFIPLSSTDSLRAAVYASEALGETTLWFKRMLTGRGEWVFQLAKKSEVNNHIPWKCPKQIGGGRTYPLIVRPTFLEHGIELAWEW
jgi:hypothetical protein